MAPVMWTPHPLKGVDVWSVFMRPACTYKTHPISHKVHQVMTYYICSSRNMSVTSIRQVLSPFPWPGLTMARITDLSRGILYVLEACCITFIWLAWEASLPRGSRHCLLHPLPLAAICNSSLHWNLNSLISCITIGCDYSFWDVFKGQPASSYLLYSEYP